MARSRNWRTIVDHDIQRLEGLRQKLKDTDAQHRPQTTAVQLIAGHCGFPPRTVKEWIRRIRPATRRSNTEQHFFDLYNEIAALLSEQLLGNMYLLASPSQRDAFRANEWLLKRVYPEEYDAALAGQTPAEDDTIFDASTVPQEVWDAMSPAEWERMEALEQRVAKVHREVEEAAARLVEEVEARLHREKRRAIVN